MTVEQLESESWLLASAEPVRHSLPRILGWINAIYSAIGAFILLAPQAGHDKGEWIANLLSVAIWAFIHYKIAKFIVERVVNALIERVNQCVFIFQDGELTEIEPFELVVWRTRLTEYLKRNHPRKCNDRWLPLEIEFKFDLEGSKSKSIIYRISVLIFYAIADEEHKRSLDFTEVAMVRNLFKDSFEEEIYEFHKRYFDNSRNHSPKRIDDLNRKLHCYSKDLLDDYIVYLINATIVA